MILGVKWSAECTHRFCPSCTHRMLFGTPRPTHESYQSYAGDFVEMHDDGRMAVSTIDDTFLFGDARRTSCPDVQSRANSAAVDERAARANPHGDVHLALRADRYRQDPSRARRPL